MPKTLNKDGVTISFPNVANITRISNPSQCQSHSESELRLTASKTSDFEYMLYVHKNEKEKKIRKATENSLARFR